MADVARRAAFEALKRVEQDGAFSNLATQKLGDLSPSRDKERGDWADGAKGRVRGQLLGRLQDLTAQSWNKQDSTSFPESEPCVTR